MGCVIIVHTSVEPIQYSWLNNVQTLPFRSENSGPFQLHYAHVRKDNHFLSMYSHSSVGEPGNEARMCFSLVSRSLTYLVCGINLLLSFFSFCLGRQGPCFWAHFTENANFWSDMIHNCLDIQLANNIQLLYIPLRVCHLHFIFKNNNTEKNKTG